MKHIRKAEKIFAVFLHSQGKRFTRERRRVLQAVMQLEGHFSLRRLLERLNGHNTDAAIHRATFYRVLPLLEESGLVRKSPSGKPGHWNYEHLVGHSHHDHFLCMRCGGVTEFRSDAIESEQVRLCKKYGFQEITHQLCIQGVCSDCWKQEQKEVIDA